MARLRYNGLTATLGADLLTAGTTITFSSALTHAAGAVPTITGTDYIPLSILDTDGTVLEIVHLTAYTTGATTGTVTRAQESTTAADHASGLTVVHGLTVADATALQNPATVQCRAYPTADVALANATTTVIPLNAETYDTSALHDNATNNSRITIVEDGNYLVIAAVTHSADTGQIQARLHKNGTQYAIDFTLGSASLAEQPKVLDVLQLVAGDYLELAAHQASGSSKVAYGGSGYTYLLVKKLN